MHVWVVLDKCDHEYEQLMDNGYLICDHTHEKCLPNMPDFENFKLCYDWMAKKLKQYINLWLHPIYWYKYRPDKLIYPRWVWYKIEGMIAPKSVNKLFYTRKPGLYQLLEFNIDPSLVLLSDYDTWHICLNYGYIVTNEEDDLEYDKYLKSLGINDVYLWDEEYIQSLSINKQKLIPKLQRDIIKSWNLIFDINNESEYIFYKNEDKTIQGVTWVLEKKDLISVQDFLITQAEVDDYNKSLNEEE